MWAKTFSRPRWDIPNTTRFAPDLADSSKREIQHGDHDVRAFDGEALLTEV